MKTVVVYDSQFGNTEKIAQTIADTLSPYGPVEIKRVDPDQPLDDQEVDLLVLGSPTQGFRETKAMGAFVNEVPFVLMPDMAVACFDTRVHGPFGSASRHLVRRLHGMGVKEMTPAMSFFVRGTEGPLADGEQERANAWALKLYEQYEVLQHLPHQAPRQ